MMIPAKEKAQELFKKHALLSWKGKEFLFNYYKQCALVTVKELIKETGAKYWYDVKHELEQL